MTKTLQNICSLHAMITNDDIQNRLWSKNENMTLKKKILKKSRKVSKNAEFHADFKSVEKVFKKEHEKSYQQKKFDEHK